ncbi:MAG: hypothetical protein HXX18_09410 [Bacteroidetes bacterium]|nr:hypothetical protein [Bacteroidota bacterium]
MNSKLILILNLLLIFFHLSYAQETKYTPSLHQLDSLLKANCNLMKQIDINDMDMLMVNDCQLNEVEAILEYLKYVNIASQIDFKKREEIAIYEYFTETTTQTAQLRVVLNQYISNLDFWFYKKAMEFLSKNDSTNANDKFDKSLLINPFYIPSLYQKAMSYLKKSQTDLATKIAQYVALNLYPVGSDLMLIKAMDEQISKQFRTRGEKMLASDLCNESLELFMQADTFCTYFNSNDCEYFKNGINQSKFGLYRSYLRVADQAMEAHKYSIAETFVMKAKEYANANRNIINNDDEADKFLKNIAQKYIDLGINYKRNADNTQSSFYFNKAKIICNLIKDIECDARLLKNEQEIVVSKDTVADNLKFKPENKLTTTEYKHTRKDKTNKLHKKIKSRKGTKKSKTKEKILPFKTQSNNIKNRNYSMYCSLIEMGDELFNMIKYEQAFEKYQAAKEMEKTVLSKPNLVLDSLINAAAFNIINTQLQTASFLIWANELPQADTAYMFCISLQQKYHLENDISTNSSLNLFRTKITQKVCQNIQDEVEQLNAKTKNYITIKDFAKAQRAIDEANLLISEHTNCNLITTTTDKLTQQLKPITDYFNLKQIAKDAFVKTEYKLFTESHYNADKIYLKNHLDTVGIPNNNIITYLNYQSDKQFILYAANYFIEFYDFDNCLASLKLLKAKGFEANKTKDIQLRLAQKQVILDKAQQSGFEPDKNIFKYTNNDKWFKVFNVEYKTK